MRLSLINPYFITDTVVFPDGPGIGRPIAWRRVVKCPGTRDKKVGAAGRQRDQRPADSEVDADRVKAAVAEPKRRVPPPAVAAPGH